MAAPALEVMVALVPLLIAALAIVVVAVALLSRRGLLPPLDEPVTLGTAVAVLAASLSFAAAAVHNVSVAQHAAVDTLEGGVFMVMAVFQAGWGVLYIALPTTGMAVLGLIANDVIIAFWAWIRFVGPASAASPASSPTIGFVDAMAILFEVLLIALLAARLAPQTRVLLGREVRFGDAAILTTFGVVTIAMVTGVTITGFGAAE